MLCLGPVPLAVTLFTLAWTHSVEKIRWEEDWRIEGGLLQLVEARIAGSGAGMEPPADAQWRGGVWHYRPALPPQPALQLSRSRYAGDYTLCYDGHCQPFAHWLGPPPATAHSVRLAPCAAR